MNDNMQISDNGLRLIMKSEGCSLESYIDTHDDHGAPLYAIGFGHQSKAGPPNVTAGMVITQDQAEQILKQDLIPFQNYIRKYVTVPLNQNQWDALVSFTYNCGPGSMHSLVGTSGLNNGNYDKVSDEMMNYNKSQGKVLLGLTRRRHAEGALFNTPVGNIL